MDVLCCTGFLVGITVIMNLLMLYDILHNVIIVVQSYEHNILTLKLILLALRYI